MQALGVVLFLLSGCVSLYVLAYTVSGAGVPGNGDVVAFEATFDDVADLDVDARVKIAGVTVGRVARIALAPPTRGSAARARVTLHLEREVAFVSDDATARIAAEGVVGSRYVAIVQGTSTNPLPAGGNIARTEPAPVFEDLVTQVVDRAVAAPAAAPAPRSPPAQAPQPQ
jgi:phospholipid/cholesterol/gamma-HCH transport system substrate-binding protein